MWPDAISEQHAVSQIRTPETHRPLTRSAYPHLTDTTQVISQKVDNHQILCPLLLTVGQSSGSSCIRLRAMMLTRGGALCAVVYASELFAEGSPLLNAGVRYASQTNAYVRATKTGTRSTGSGQARRL